MRIVVGRKTRRKASVEIMARLGDRRRLSKVRKDLLRTGGRADSLMIKKLELEVRFVALKEP